MVEIPTNKKGKKKMKKTLSFVLALAMVMTLVMTLFVGVGAAKDGDVLFEANFKSTDANFAPKTQYGTAPTPTISEDGKTVTFNFDENSANGIAWGDSIKSLKITADTRYTVTSKFKSESAGGDNAGLAVATNNSDKGYDGWYSLYGRTSNNSFTMNHRQTSASEFNWGSFPFAKDADGYVTVKFEFVGYNVGVYALTSEGNYVLKDGFVIAENDGNSHAIMCGLFTWVNKGRTSVVSIKDFVVTQGCSDYPNVLNAKDPGNFKDYTNGALIWSANFKGDSTYAPKAIDADGKRGATTATASEDGKTLTVKGHTYGTTDASVGAAYFYTATPNNLKIYSDSKYTIEFKVRIDANYGGVTFLKMGGVAANEYVSVYGDLKVTGEQYTIARGTRTAAYTAGGQFSNAYSKFPADKTTNGEFTEFKVEINGYDVTVYYNTAEGYKTLVTYTIPYSDASIACGVYNYQSNSLIELKDFNVYKGLTLSEDYSTPDVPPVENNPDTGDASAMILLSAIALISLGGALIAKKAR